MLAKKLLPGIAILLTALCSMGSARPFEVHDSVEMAGFTHEGIFSPDHRYFIAVTERGLLPEGVTEATIWLFDTKAVLRRVGSADRAAEPQPIALARLRGQGPVITRPTWHADSQSLLFLGRDGRENGQLFRVRLADRKAIALTPPTQDVVDFGLMNDHIFYFAGPDVGADKVWWSNDPSAPDIVSGVGQSFMDLLYPNYQKHNRTMPTRFELWHIEAGRAEPVIEANTGHPMQVLGSYNVSTISPSQDGAYAIAIVFADRIPPRWEKYEVVGGLDHRRFRADPPSGVNDTDYSRALQYQLFDIGNGTRRPLLQAPVADFQRGGRDALQAVWSSDGGQVAVSGTYLPLGEPENAGQSTQPCGVAVVTTEGGKVTCLIDRMNTKIGPVSGIAWRGTGQTLLVEADEERVFSRHAGRWRLARQRTPKPSSPLEVTIEQGLDVPPALYARDRSRGRAQKIFDPNPQLANITLGSVSVYIWKDAHGREINGGLARPPGFRLDRRYPLVIQTHNFRSRRFFRTGGSETAAAGRALAAHDMVVLQVDEPEAPYGGTWEEATENGTKVYLAAIDQLAKEGVIDPERVGITGYSRMGFYVARAITDAPDRFAAAAVANADPGSLVGYYTYVDYVTPSYVKGAANFMAGAQPYGEGLKDWFERAPGFRTDRIQAPVLICAGDPQHLISLWGLYAPLRDQGKPVELQYFRSGEHNLKKPLHILAHQEMLVDWFDFWLNGHEDKDSHKAAQYARWQKLRDPQHTGPAVDGLSPDGL